MKTYTVQCGDVRHYANTIVVEAATLEEALERAIEKANDDPHWKASEDCSTTFVDAAAEGANVDPWTDGRSAIPIPDPFTERGEPPSVTVIVEGGLVKDVVIEGGKVRVLVKDYDTDGLDSFVYDVGRDEDGGEYTLTDWTNEFPPDAAE